MQPGQSPAAVPGAAVLATGALDGRCRELLLPSPLPPNTPIPAHRTPHPVLNTPTQGKSDQVAAQLKSDWLGVVKANWMLWVPVQFFNFRFVPVNFQV